MEPPLSPVIQNPPQTLSRCSSKIKALSLTQTNHDFKPRGETHLDSTTKLLRTAVSPKRKQRVVVPNAAGLMKVR